MKQQQLQIWYDDTPDAVVDKINAILEQRGLAFVMDDKEHDGFCLYDLKEVTARGGN